MDSIRNQTRTSFGHLTRRWAPSSRTTEDLEVLGVQVDPDLEVQDHGWRTEAVDEDLDEDEGSETGAEEGDDTT